MLTNMNSFKHEEEPRKISLQHPMPNHLVEGSQRNFRWYKLISKTIYRSMEQGRQPRTKPMHLWSINLPQRRQEYTMEKRQPLQ